MTWGSRSAVGRGAVVQLNQPSTSARIVDPETMAAKVAPWSLLIER